jgi:CheY-like chemotaxis protein
VIGAATEADEAVRLGAQERPDLILLDIRLARGSDGIQAAIKLYQDHNLRCVFVSAHTDGSRNRASLAQPLGWIVKPFTAAVLVGGSSGPWLGSEAAELPRLASSPAGEVAAKTRGFPGTLN